jgi:hypothetical protein
MLRKNMLGQCIFHEEHEEHAKPMCMYLSRRSSAFQVYKSKKRLSDFRHSSPEAHLL